MNEQQNVIVVGYCLTKGSSIEIFATNVIPSDHTVNQITVNGRVGKAISTALGNLSVIGVNYKAKDENKVSWFNFVSNKQYPQLTMTGRQVGVVGSLFAHKPKNAKTNKLYASIHKVFSHDGTLFEAF
ncbi:MAG: hypothetical protein ACRDBG_11175 [Waterburya sp.]